MVKGILCAILSCATLAAVPVRAETITWAMMEFPPASMPVDNHPGEGINDLVLKAIAARMKDDQHQYITANMTRIRAMLDDGEQICFVGALRNPERARLYYLDDMAMAPPLQIIVRADAVSKLPLNQAGEVDLQALLAKNDVSGLLVDKRSYGSKLDQIIAARPPNSKVIMATPGDLGSKFFAMISIGRADYTLDYDFTLAYQRKLDPNLITSLKALPIAGNNEPEVVSVMCPRTPWGKHMIVRIDQVIAHLAADGELVAATEKWITAESLQRYAPEIRAFNSKRAKPGRLQDFK